MFRSLLLPIRFNSPCSFNSSFPFIASFLSFHLFPTMRYFRPLVSSLISCSFFLPFRFNSSLPFAPAFLLIFLCRLNCSFPFAASFLSFQVSSSICYFLSFVLTLMSCSFRFSFRFNSSFLFVASVPSYQLFCLARLALPFLSPCPFRCVHPFVLTLPSYLLFLSFRFNSHLTSHRKLEKMPFARKAFFFQVFKGGAIRAGICRPSSHLRPLAATCPSGHLRPLAAICGHLRPLGCKWLQVAANNENGCKWRCSGNFKSYQQSNRHVRPRAATCGHVRPRAATCGHLRPRAATCGHVRPLAATCGHLRPLAATSGHLRPLAATCGHLRPLAATCGHLPSRPLAATCGHSSGCKWLQVAAFLNFKYRAFCNLNETKQKTGTMGPLLSSCWILFWVPVDVWCI